jgi:hypothetical protein
MGSPFDPARVWNAGEPAVTVVLPVLALGARWTEGLGMHLSADSISNPLGEDRTDIHGLMHLYDEALSHHI